MRVGREGIPLKFIRTHGDIFHTPELWLTGPNGHSRPVMLKVRPYRPYGRVQVVNRVYLSRGWREFVKENGFEVGDRIVFWMVKKSTFHVLCSRLEEKAVFKNATLSGISSNDEEESGHDNNPTLSGISSKDDEESGQDNNITIENVAASEPPLILKVYHRRVEQETAPPKCETNFNPAEAPGQQWHCGSPDKGKVIAVKKMSPILGEEDFVKHPGLASAVSLGSRFPQFVRKLTKISLMGSKDIHLDLPFPFVQEHGHKFQAHVFLLGPSGRLRIVSLRIMSTGRRGRSRVQIRQGWKDFALEHGFKVGDVLLFSLVGLSKFVVQLFPSV